MHGSREREEAAIRRDCDLADCGEKDCGALGVFGESKTPVNKVLPTCTPLEGMAWGVRIWCIHRAEEKQEIIANRGLTRGGNPVYFQMAGALLAQARNVSSFVWSHSNVGGCTRRSKPGFSFSGDLK